MIRWSMIFFDKSLSLQIPQFVLFPIFYYNGTNCILTDESPIDYIIYLTFLSRKINQKVVKRSDTTLEK